MKFLDLRSPKNPGPGTMLGDTNFLKFVAKIQTFPGEAERRVGCWGLNPIQ